MNIFRNTFERLRGLSLSGVKKVVVAVVGGTVLLIGICLIVLPGPAMLVIPAGLAILATEFVWARRWLHKARDLALKAKHALRKKPPATAQERASVSSPPSTK